MSNKFISLFSSIRGLFCIALIFAQLSCAEIEKATAPKPLEGADVTVYDLAEGQVEFRMKITGLTSTVWMTTELVNKSNKEVYFDSNTLVQFSDPTCMGKRDYEDIPATTLKPQARQLLHYSFQLYAKRKNSPEFERCKDQPLRFVVSGLQINAVEAKPFTFTISDEK